MTVRISLAFLNRQERAATAKDIIELYKTIRILFVEPYPDSKEQKLPISCDK